MVTTALSITDMPLSRFRTQLTSVPVITKLYSGTVLFIVTWLWSSILWQDASGNIVTSGVTIWGDWAIHFTLGSYAAYNSPVYSSNPLLITEPLLYPFFSDWLAGILVRIGMPFFASFIFLSYIFTLFTFFAVYYFVFTISKKHLVATLSSLFFFLSGGLGFLPEYNGFVTLTAWKNHLVNPVVFFTKLPDQSIQWISVFESMIIPQRSFIIGFPVALIGLAAIYKQKCKKPSQRRFTSGIATAAVLFGFLPIIHAHSFIAVGLILAFWSVYDCLSNSNQLEKCVVFWAKIASLSGVVALFFLSRVVSQRDTSFITLQLGWMADEGVLNFLWFWIKNLSLLPILGLLGLYTTSKYTSRRQLTSTLVPFILLFALGNVILFQPWEWDNTKIFVWGVLAFSIFSAYFIEFLLKKLSHSKVFFYAFFMRFYITFLIFFTIAAGSFDLYTILNGSHRHYEMYSAQDLKRAEWVRKNTSPQSIWLTGTHHNNWLFNLTGRQALMVYPGWLWSQGYSYVPVHTDLVTLYTNPSSALLEKYSISYVIIGPKERELYQPLSEAYAEMYPAVYKDETTTIYKVAASSSLK